MFNIVFGCLNLSRLLNVLQVVSGCFRLLILLSSCLVLVRFIRLFLTFCRLCMSFKLSTCGLGSL